MNYGRSVVVAGIIILSATLAACGGGSSDSAASATTQDSSPVVSSRGADLHSSSSNTTAAAASTTAAALTANTGAAAASVSTVIHTTPSTISDQPQSLTLSWSAPDENADGTPLVDLSGYKIRYGTASGNYTQTVTLNNAGLNRFVVDNLPAGTYYFTISAYNSSGIESPLSGEVSTTI